MGKTSTKSQPKRPESAPRRGKRQRGFLALEYQAIIDKLGGGGLGRRFSLAILLVLVLLLICALISVISFLFSGGSDQSLIAPDVHLTPEELQKVSTKNVLGIPGARLADYIFNGLFGWGGVFLLMFLAFLIYRMRFYPERTPLIDYLIRFIRDSFLTIWTATTAAALQALFPSDSFLLWGGERGAYLYSYIQMRVGSTGLLLVLVGSLAVFLVLFSTRFLRFLEEPPSLPHPKVPKPRLGSFFSRLFSKKSSDEQAPEAEEENNEQGLVQDEDAWRDEPPAYASSETAFAPKEEPVTVERPLQSAPPSGPTTSTEMIIEEAPKDDLVEDEGGRHEPLAPGILLAHYQKPTTDLLRDYELGGSQIDIEEIEYNKQKIIDTLASFKMHVTPHKATVGPTVTLYEVIPDSGIKVSRIKTMEDDIAMSLKSEGVRIIAPMPGQGTIGIEVPNSSPQTVSMRSILASRKYKEQLEKMELPIGIGKTITNEPFIFDLAKMPHLLVAGATGQGKSVGLNALITSLLYSKRPEELKFVMVDPKMLEFAVYEEIERHFLAKLPDADRAIITDMSKVVATLNSLCVEMDNRYRLLQGAGRTVRNIREYNEQVRSGELRRIDGHELLPYIVLIVDEFADLMMTVGKEVEQPIARLAQKARAAGIHMVIATQRPSTDVITGLIKANFPARIAFKVFSMVDSRTVLDSPGANQLIGRGDMLFYQGKDMIRVQCAFMDSPETEAIVEHISQQESTGAAYELPEYIPEGEDTGTKTFSASEKDSLFDEVARMVVQTQVGSTSNIQRKFNIGYNRAGRLMDQLEGAGIVGPQEGSKPREVYIKDQMSLDQLLQQLG